MVHLQVALLISPVYTLRFMEMEAIVWGTLFRTLLNMIGYPVISKHNQQMEVLFLGEHDFHVIFIQVVQHYFIHVFVFYCFKLRTHFSTEYDKDNSNMAGKEK